MHDDASVSLVYGSRHTCRYVSVCLLYETHLAKKIIQAISRQLQKHEQEAAESAENEEMRLHDKALEEAMCVCVCVCVCVFVCVCVCAENEVMLLHDKALEEASYLNPKRQKNKPKN
jgi:p-aminobenzoyl-glutamate transporter AbgT